MLKLTGKKLTALAAAALTTLTISATAFAAAFTSADAQSMNLRNCFCSSLHLGGCAVHGSKACTGKRNPCGY